MLIPTWDNGALNFGDSYTTNYISKLDSTGNIKWTRSYNFDFVNSTTTFIDGVRNRDSTNTVVGVVYTNNSFANGYVFCLKLKSNGDTLWCRKLMHSSFASLIPYSLCQTNDSGFVICGQASGSTVSSFVAKLSKTGALTWMKTLSSSFLSNAAYSIKQTTDSGYVMTGEIQNSSSDQSIFCSKLDKQGNLIWHKRYSESNTQNYSSGYDITVETDGYLMLAHTNSNLGSLVKIDFSGSILWAKQYNNAYASIIDQTQFPGRSLTLRKTTGHGRLITYKTNDFEGTALMTDTLGNFKWGAFTYLSSLDMVQLKNKSFVLIGNPPAIVERVSSPGSYGDLGIIVSDSLGTNSYTCYSQKNLTASTFTLSITSMSSSLTAGGTLSAMHPTLGVISLSTTLGCVDLPNGIEKYSMLNMRISPNPSNGKIIVQSDYLKNQALHFEVRDVTGRTLMLGQLEAGTEKSEMDLQSLNNGVYFYSIFSKNEVVKKGKIIISK